MDESRLSILPSSIIYPLCSTMLIIGYIDFLRNF